MSSTFSLIFSNNSNILASWKEKSRTKGRPGMLRGAGRKALGCKPQLCWQIILFSVTSLKYFPHLSPFSSCLPPFSHACITSGLSNNLSIFSFIQDQLNFKYILLQSQSTQQPCYQVLMLPFYRQGNRDSNILVTYSKLDTRELQIELAPEPRCASYAHAPPTVFCNIF